MVMTDTVLLVGLLVIFAGLVRPEWVRRRRAFGWSVVLALAVFLLCGVGLGILSPFGWGAPDDG
jgi:hypothetical protein